MTFETNLGVFVCPHVFRNVRPVLLVVHEDNEWQCLCGFSDHNEDCHLVGIGHLVDRDASIDELSDLPNGWEAERESEHKQWILKKC